MSARIPDMFQNRRSRWLPLYRRLLARLARIPGLELEPLKSSLTLVGAGSVKATIHGLEISLSLKKAALRSTRLMPALKSASKRFTHRVLIERVDEIDDELITWIQAARAHSAHSAAPKSPRAKSAGKSRKG